ncbi:MAG TPA: amidohydrolase family protein [Deltaproteobacteria bacterium]|nr:amidohydrolase family protein [Deltaproteobacteria bacterium]
MVKLPETIIDFHVHLFPDRLFESIWQFFEKGYGQRVLHHLYYRQCVDYLRQRGIGTIVYSNYAHRPGVADGINAWNLEILEEIPDLYCFAAYHPGDADALKAAERLLRHPRIIGFKLHLLVQRLYPHDERLMPLYEMVQACNKRMLMHTGTGPVGNEFVGLEHFRKLLRRFPELPVNVAHMGALEYRGFMELLDDHPNLYLDTAFTFYPGIPGAFDLGPEYLERHQDRIVYGSDFPNLILPREMELDCLLGYRLPQAFYDAVFRDNARRILGGITGRRPDVGGQP